MGGRDVIYENIFDIPVGELDKDIFVNHDSDDYSEVKLKDSFRGFILKNLEKLLKGYKYNRVYFVGSMVSYNYNSHSDIDIHFSVNGVDKEEICDLIDEFGDLYFKEHRVEFYVMDDDDLDKEVKKGGVVDVVKNVFLSKPDRYDITDLNFFYILQIADIFISALESRINEFIYDVNEYLFLLNKYEKVKNEDDRMDINNRLNFLENEIRADVDSIKVIWKIIKYFRGTGFNEDEVDLGISFEVRYGNMSLQNVVYKVIERLGLREVISKYKKYDVEKLFKKRRGEI